MTILKSLILRLFVSIAFITSIHSTQLNHSKVKHYANNSNEISNHRLIRSTQSDQSLNYRLPNNSLPLSYDLWIKTDIHKGDFRFYGRVKIKIRIEEESQVITMHSRDIIIVNVDLKDENDFLLRSNLTFRYVDNKEFLEILLPSHVSINTEIMLDISYNGTMTNEKNGFYAVLYKNKSFENVWIATTHFLPTNAHRAFPCYDEPQIRASIRLRIEHDKSYHALSNMPTSKIGEGSESNYQLTIFRDTPPIQTYLLSFIVSDFIYNSNSNEIIEQRVYGEPPLILNGTAKFAVQVVGEILEKFLKIFPIEIEIDKIDHVQIPQANGALEHYGLVQYEESFLLLDENFDEDVQEFFKPSIIETITHGIAHQYFGGIVAPNWWQYLWLMEGFSMFYEYYIPSLLYPQYEYMEKFQAFVIGYAFDVDIGSDTMDDYAESPHEIQNKFNSIVFEKSASVIRMFHEALSPTTFTKGLVFLFEEMRYKAINSADLYKALQRAFNADNPDNNLNITRVMSSWESQAGYPVVDVKKSGKNIILTQRRFKDANINNNNNNIYSIPITFATKSNPNFNKTTANLWMTSKTLEINEILSTSDEWIILNIQQVGFYRVDYSWELWESIMMEYKRNFKIIHHTNRKVLHDEMYIAWKILKTKTASDCLAFLSVLEYEESGAVWDRAAQYIDPLYDFLLYSDVYELFQDLMHKILEPHMNTLKDVSKDEKKLSNEVRKWSRLTQHPLYLRQELDKLLLYMKDEKSAKPDFCSALRYANATIYRHFINEVIEFEVFLDLELVTGLGCSMNHELLNELFDALLNPVNEVAPFISTNAVFATIDSSVVGLEVVMDLINDKWWELNQLVPNFVEEILSFMHLFINSAANLEKFKSLTNKLIRSRIVSPELIESLVRNIEVKLQDEEWNNIKEWFGKDDEQTSSTITTSTSQTESTTPDDAVTVYTSIRIIAICISLCFLLKRNCT